MPTKLIQTKITFKSAREKRQVEKLAKLAGLSLSNYVRQQLGLAPLQHGGARISAPRSDKQGEGSHAYKAADYDVVAMADGRWCLFLNGEDTGRDYRTLAEARRAIEADKR